MKTASVANVKARFSEFVRASKNGPVVITRNGKAVAAIVPLANDDEVESLLLSYSPKLRAILSAGRQRVQDGAGVGHDDFWREVEAVPPTARGRKRVRGRI